MATFSFASSASCAVAWFACASLSASSASFNSALRVSSSFTATFKSWTNSFEDVTFASASLSASLATNTAWVASSAFAWREERVAFSAFVSALAWLNSFSACFAVAFNSTNFASLSAFVADKVATKALAFERATTAWLCVVVADWRVSFKATVSLSWASCAFKFEFAVCNAVSASVTVWLAVLRVCSACAFSAFLVATKASAFLTLSVSLALVYGFSTSVRLKVELAMNVSGIPGTVCKVYIPATWLAPKHP